MDGNRQAGWDLWLNQITERLVSQVTKQIKTISVLLVMILLAGCVDREVWLPATVGVSHTPSPRAARSITLTPDIVNMSVPLTTPVQTKPNNATPQIPTLTALPTLSPDLAEQMVGALLQDNAGCRFPCWWGITPGETTWIEANHFFESFTKITSYPNKDFDGRPMGVVTYSISYPLLTNQGQRMTGFEVDVENGQISIVAVGSGNQIDATLLHKLLSDYGPPGQIYLHTSDRVPEGYDIPLRLVLYYPDQHFLARYEFIAREDPGNLDSLVSCFTAENPALYFWSPEEVVTEQRVQDWTLGVDPFIPLKPLDQVTDLDIASFTKVFSTSSDEGNCIRTRKEFWVGTN